MSVEQIERLRVAWDTDAGGRIHFTAVFRYAELAETVLRRRLGLLGNWADYPRRHVEADYFAVLRFDDVACEVEALGDAPAPVDGRAGRSRCRRRRGVLEAALGDLDFAHLENNGTGVVLRLTD